MALSILNLTVELYSNDDCDGLILEDITGLYSANNLNGYNLPNGVAVNDVTELVITLNYTILSVSAVYTFTIVNGVITAATIEFNGASPVDILSQLSSTAFPFTSTNPFEFFNSYVDGSSTIALPSIEDGAYSVSYNITGSALDVTTETDFDLTATDMVLVDCATCCCINNLFAAIPEDCGCDDSKSLNAITAKSYLEIARYAVEVDNSERANIFINKAKTVCDCDCGCH